MARTDDGESNGSTVIAAGSPRPEHVIFVVIGVVATLAILLHVYLVFVG